MAFRCSAKSRPATFSRCAVISAWRKDDSSTPIDFDALPAADVDVPGRYNNKQISQEFQVLVNAGRLNGLIGAYYLDADASTPFDVRLFTSTLA